MKKPAALRPFVLVNMSMTADGKIATANRAVSSFGSRRDQQHLYELRATVDAVMSGARTIEAGEVELNAGGKKFQEQRKRNGLAKENLRVLVSGSGSINPAAHIFGTDIETLLLLTSRKASPAKLSKLRVAATHISKGSEINFSEALSWLAKKWGVKRLLCEGGGTLNDALFRADLVDEIHLTICPFIFGGSDAPTMAEGKGFERLVDARRFQISRRRVTGNEMFLTLSRIVTKSSQSEA